MRFSLQPMFLSFLVVACVATLPAIPDLVWPPAPETPRIRLTAVVDSPASAGIATGPWSSFVRWVFGESRDEKLAAPFSVALRNGRIAIGDTHSGEVWLLDRPRRRYYRITSVDGHGLRSPVGLALADDGIWISDSISGIVQKVTANGKRLAVVSGIGRPAGIALAADGRLAIAQPTEQRVAILYPDGHRSVIGEHGDGPGQFNFPTQVAFAAAGDLFVNDALNFRIQHFDTDLRFVVAFGAVGDRQGYFARPRGIAVDAEGHVFVSDALFDIVQVFDGNGNLLLTFGGGGHESGAFWSPAGIAVDGRELVVADMLNSRVQLFKLLSGINVP